MTSLGRRIVGPFLGRPNLQPLFQAMHNAALAGMGYGEGNNPATSGEEGVLDYVHSRVCSQERVNVFDVGANVGEYAERVIERWGRRLDLWCFEPSASTCRILRERVGSRPGVTLEKLGLSESNGCLVLHTSGEGSKVASVHEGQASEREGALSEEIAVRTVDSYCADHGIRALDLLKIDVEGHELCVLRGAREMLERGAIRFIQFEFSAACVDARVYFRDYWELLHRSYLIYRVLAHGLTQVLGYDESREVFKRATNYLAERR
ncbi:MAG: FkbM family methyltransferase [Armatimonadetes bacterium]|nr:FkbM family methyltransferase [Armatimonadota bacterium]